MSNNTQESSLTTPGDRDLTNKWLPDQRSPKLTAEEGDAAVSALNNNDFVSKFPKIDRTYADPPVNLQNFGLISWVPAKGAKPNDNGVYGFAKLRGNYASEMEAQQRAEFLVREIDSYHQIFHTFVGRPFPLTESSNFSKAVDEVDLKKQMTESISSNIKKKKQDDAKEIRVMQEREKELLQKSERAKKDETNEDDDYEAYITLRVKKAQLTWTYTEHQEKMREIENILVDTRLLIEDYDEDHPEYAGSFFDKYKEARAASGLEETGEELETSFMKYMVQDLSIPKVDEMYLEKKEELAKDKGKGAA